MKNVWIMVLGIECGLVAFLEIAGCGSKDSIADKEDAGTTEGVKEAG